MITSARQALAFVRTHGVVPASQSELPRGLALPQFEKSMLGPSGTTPVGLIAVWLS
jgi:hypothetical protein